jgi:hypothetical protein
MSTESVCLFAMDIFLGQTIVEPAVIEAPVPQAIPLTACLRVEFEAIILPSNSAPLLYLLIFVLSAYVHILTQFVYFMLQNLSEVLSSVVHLF